MPFTKVGPDQWRGPSGKLFTQSQVDLYEANNGFPEKGSAYRKAQAVTSKKKRTPPSSRLLKRTIGG